MKVDFGFDIKNEYYNMEHMVVVFNYLFISLLFSATFWSFIQNDYLLATVQLGVAFAMLFTYLSFTQNENINTFITLTITIYFISSLGYYIYADKNLLSALSLLFFPFIALMLTGIKVGSIITILYIFIIISHNTTLLGHELTQEEFFDISIGLFLSAILAFMIENNRKRTFSHISESMKRLEEISLKDSLTGLYNRHYLNKMLNSHKLDNKPLLFCITDIDNFKNYNDFYGHQQGDTVLHDIAQIKKTIFDIENQSFVIRLGGEEFGGFIYGLPDPRHLLEAFQDQISLLDCEHIKNAPYNKCTVSIGAVFCENSGTLDFSKLYQTADDALYEAKLKGKNQIVWKNLST
jgi:diguanylate cyclase (GGDEF)-like protein